LEGGKRDLELRRESLKLEGGKWKERFGAQKRVFEVGR
jgi:hypothetical protein